MEWLIINILAVGVFYALMVYYTDSIWFPMAHHAAWNFTQNILLDLPNSGNVVPYSVFKIDAASATSSFAYDTRFGIEGSVLATLMMIVGCVILFLWGRKHGKKPTMSGLKQPKTDLSIPLLGRGIFLTECHLIAFIRFILIYKFPHLP